MSEVNENHCPKCKLADMEPRYFSEGQTCDYVGSPVEGLNALTKDNPMRWRTEILKECLVWSCPKCKYRIAKKID